MLKRIRWQRFRFSSVTSSARLIFDLRDQQPEAFPVRVALALAPLDELVDVGDAGPDIELIRRLLSRWPTPPAHCRLAAGEAELLAEEIELAGHGLVEPRGRLEITEAE